MELGYTVKINGEEFDLDLVVDYTISGGQVGIYNAAPEDCQPEYPADVEIEIESMEIEYGKHNYKLTKESRWWDIIEERLNEDDWIIAQVFEDATEAGQPDY